MISPLFLQPPVDKSFSFIAQIQGLQVHRPQKGEKGCGGVCGGGGKENGESGDERGRSCDPPYSGLTLKSTPPLSLAALSP